MQLNTQNELQNNYCFRLFKYNFSNLHDREVFVSKNEEVVLKFGTLISFLGIVGAVIVAHFHGIDAAVLRSKNYTDREISHVKEDVIEIKKKIDQLQSR